MDSLRSLGSLSAALLLTIPIADKLEAVSCAPGTFRQAPTTTLSNISFLAAGDVNGDERLDLVVPANVSGDLGVAVLLAVGDGTFLDPIARVVPGGYYSFAIGDFDGDTKADLVTGGYQRLAFFRGNGDGTFQDEVDTGILGYPSSLRPVDLNGDGKLDLLALQNPTLFFEGKGNGTFFDADTATPLVVPEQSAIADLDADGRLDLAVPLSSGRVGVLAGLGDGTFGPVETFVAGKGVSSVAAGDFDSDGKPDLAVTVTGRLAFLKGLGDGSFLASVEYYAGSNPGAAVAADFDSDGKLDLAVTNNGDYYSSSAGSVSILFGDGAGAFDGPAGYIVGTPTRLIAGDFSADGIPDLAGVGLVCCGGSSVAVLINDGGRSFEGVGNTDADVESSLLASGDFDNDGKLDLLVGGPAYPTSRLRLLLGGPRGTFHPAAVIFGGDSMVSMGVGDFDADGNLDFVVSNANNANFQVFLGDGNGTFQPPATYPAESYYTGALAVGDWDLDGKLDVALSWGYDPVRITLFRGRGDGTFESTPAGPAIPFLPASFVTADFNGDGLADLVGSGAPGYSNPNYIFVLVAVGDGTFEPPSVETADTSPGSVGVGDFDEDGALDLAVANAASGNVSILFGNGDASFAPPVQIGLAWDPFSIAVVDFDGDGHADFATANRDDSSVGLALGLGNGSFRSPAAYRVGPAPLGMAVGDFDGGGALDLAVTSSAQAVSVLLNTELAVSSPAPVQVCGGAPATLSVEASGFGPLQYQWRKGGLPLSDGGNVTGATTRSLRIDPTSGADAGSYNVVVSDACGFVPSAATALSVPAEPAVPVISAPVSVAPGAAGLTASVPAAAGHTYQWSLTGGTITAGQGSNAIAFSAGAAGTTISLEVVDVLAAGCSSDPGQTKVHVDFLDVPPSHLFHGAIVSNALAGITSGCGAGRFCPDDPVTRDAMAVFILRGKNGGTFLPPPATGNVLEDVTATTFLARWVEQFFTDGLTTGCGTSPGASKPNYCPTDNVTRDGMSVFLLRGKNGSAFLPPAATGTVFGDVTVATFLARWMEGLKAANITQGCGGGNYCPLGLVSRGEMASFIRRTFGL